MSQHDPPARLGSPDHQSHAADEVLPEVHDEPAAPARVDRSGDTSWRIRTGLSGSATSGPGPVSITDTGVNPVGHRPGESQPGTSSRASTSWPMRRSAARMAPARSVHRSSVASDLPRAVSEVEHELGEV